MPGPARQVEEQETLREGEVLLQQAVAGEPRQRDRQQCMFVVEAHGLHAVSTQHLLGGRAVGRQHQHTEQVAADQFVQLVRQLVVGAAEQAQVLQRQSGEVQAGRGLQPDAQASAIFAPFRHPGQRQVGGMREVGDRRDFQRPQLHVVRGAEPAFGVRTAGGSTAQFAAPWHLGPGRQCRVSQRRLQLRHHHRRRGRQVVRVDDLEQPFGEARKFGVQLELHPGGQEREAFQQAFDIGVADLDAIHAQAGRDLRELLRELGTHLTQVLQFLVVVAKQSRDPSRGVGAACR
jgi:hypothetical protein